MEFTNEFTIPVGHRRGLRGADRPRTGRPVHAGRDAGGGRRGHLHGPGQGQGRADEPDLHRDRHGHGRGPATTTAPGSRRPGARSGAAGPRRPTCAATLHEADGETVVTVTTDINVTGQAGPVRAGRHGRRRGEDHRPVRGQPARDARRRGGDRGRGEPEAAAGSTTAEGAAAEAAAPGRAQVGQRPGPAQGGLPRPARRGAGPGGRGRRGDGEAAARRCSPWCCWCWSSCGRRRRARRGD